MLPGAQVRVEQGQISQSLNFRIRSKVNTGFRTRHVSVIQNFIYILSFLQQNVTITNKFAIKSIIGVLL